MQMRKKLNLTIHPDIRTYAEALAKKRRRSISQLFEDLVEAEWIRRENELKLGGNEGSADEGQTPPARGKNHPSRTPPPPRKGQGFRKSVFG